MISHTCTLPLPVVSLGATRVPSALRATARPTPGVVMSKEASGGSGSQAVPFQSKRRAYPDSLSELPGLKLNAPTARRVPSWFSAAV